MDALMSFTRALAPGATIRYIGGFLSAPEADTIFASLAETIEWQQHWVHIAGRRLPAPRLSAWIGDPDAAYRYSGVTYAPLPWTSELRSLRARIEGALALRFNSVLANLYRDGQDAMGAHADDEPELGPEPVIAALSLGAARDIRFTPNRPAAAGETAAFQSFNLELGSGSLLVMSGQTQAISQHAIPRRKRVQKPRISLTFRRVRSR